VELSVEPSPQRNGLTWGDFFGSQAKSALACDFFPVDTVFLRRLDAFFFIELETRRVYISGVTKIPTREWAIEQARNLTSRLDQRAIGVKFLIRDGESSSPPALTKSSTPKAFGSSVRRLARPRPTPSPSASLARLVENYSTGYWSSATDISS
jgi:hypothetical protein